MIETRYYLLHIWGDVEPAVLGPYETEKNRDRKARKLRLKDPENHNGIFMLDVPDRGNPKAYAYRAGFLGDE